MSNKDFKNIRAGVDAYKQGKKEGAIKATVACVVLGTIIAIIKAVL